MELLLTYLSALADFFLEVAPLLLLGLLIAGVLHVLFPEHLVERHLGQRSSGAVFKATLFGIPIPLCSCSVIPVMSSLKRKGASNGASISFLVSAPQIGADSYALTYGLLGPLFAVFRILAALVTALLAGLAENLLPEARQAAAETAPMQPDSGGSWRQRLRGLPAYIMDELLGSLANSLVLGILLATLIVVLVPDNFLAGLGTGAGLGASLLSMAIMLVIGVPMYVCATASTPIAAALLLKGISPGAALVFLLAGPATNAITLSTVYRQLGRRATALYLSSIALVSLAAGLLLDLWLGDEVLAESLHLHQHEMAPGWWELLGAGLLALLLARHYGRYFLQRGRSRAFRAKGDLLEWKVDGMTCMHCVQRLSDSVQQRVEPGELQVDLGSGTVQVRDPRIGQDGWRGDLRSAIEDAGFHVEQEG